LKSLTKNQTLFCLAIYTFDNDINKSTA